MFFQRDGYDHPYKTLDETHDQDVTNICERFEVDTNTYFTSGFGAGKICEGMFIIKSLRWDNTTLDVNFPSDLRYMHFSNSNLSTLPIIDTIQGYHVPQPGVDFVDEYNLFYDPDTDNTHNLLNGYWEHPFNTSLKHFHPETVINGSYNTHAMHYANLSNSIGNESGSGIPGTVKCKIDSITADNEHDLWSHDSSGNVRDMPAIVRNRDRYVSQTYQNNDPSVSQLQQASFIINAVSTNLSDIGSPTWKKDNITFYETVNDFQRKFGDPGDLNGWDTVGGSNYHGIPNDYGGYAYSILNQASTAPIMLDAILKTNAITDSDVYPYQDYVFGVSEVTKTANTCNYTRTQLPLMDYDGISSFFANKAFIPDSNYWGYNPNVHYELLDRNYLMCIPVLFSKLAGQASNYGYGGVYQNSETSYLDIFGIANLVATKFKLSNTKYYNFVIYATGDAATTYTISYAIDLRQISSGGAKAGKTTVSIANNSTDVLLIAHKNIYVVSESQITSYIHNIHN